MFVSPPSMDVTKATPVASCLRSPYLLSWRGLGQLYRHLLLFICRDSSAGVVTGRARNRGSIPGKDQIFISCSKSPDRLWGSTNSVFIPEFLLRETEGIDNTLTSSPKIRNEWSYTSNTLTLCTETDLPVTIRKATLNKLGNECTEQVISLLHRSYFVNH
jgi:hypothetical protein